MAAHYAMAKYGKSESHSVYGPWEDLHTSVGGYDGGKCVGPHQGYYHENDSCSYRWQAVHRLEGEDKAHYDRSLYKNCKALNNAIRKKAKSTAGKLMAGGALAREPGPPGAAQQFITSKMFRTGFYPFNNNAHHLLPDAELRKGIFGVAGESTAAQDLIVKGLLENSLNINHHRNMMILPQDIEISCAMSLPRHVHGDSHVQYSAVVRSAVDGVMSAYEPIVADIKSGKTAKDHDNPAPLDIVEALMGICDTLHTMVLALKPLVATRCAADGIVSVNSFAPQASTALGV